MFVDTISESGIDDLLDDLRNEIKVRDRAVWRRAGSFGSSVRFFTNGRTMAIAAAGELRLAE